MPSLARPSRRSLGAFSRGSCHDWVYPSFWGCLSLCLCIPPHDFHLGVHLPLFMLIDFFLCLLLSPGLAFSLSFFLPPTHTHCHTLTHTHALLHTLTTLSSSHNLIYIHTLYTQTFTHTPTHTHTLSLPHTLIHKYTLPHHIHTLSFTTLSYTLSHVLTHTLTHIHTTFTCSNTRIHFSLPLLVFALAIPLTNPLLLSHSGWKPQLSPALQTSMGTTAGREGLSEAPRPQAPLSMSRP